MQALAGTGKSPKEGPIQKTAKTAIKILKRMIIELPTVATLAEASQKLLPTIVIQVFLASGRRGSSSGVGGVSLRLNTVMSGMSCNPAFFSEEESDVDYILAVRKDYHHNGRYTHSGFISYSLKK